VLSFSRTLFSVCTRDTDAEPPTAVRPAWEARESRDPRRTAAAAMAVLCVVWAHVR
jgi:hypothetical protein